ncbi:ie-0 [Euproctis pseudoconspersa nucleopolyhedrovirus]|uniref:Ie-0 n=1 Tax=Euproctis pseudoconspersa nucleopolyhedrovirus TaxID=307467 RepID=C3TWS2_9ABAC|nr:ie-0 [Euproctis pseudoconspersa nucleopolyhedrovirus]ACO53464.1 ie-0 [Euproctis pseudoconspersa nucleopolyhedrovirus]QUJ09208.1 ie-0 protein [Gynaephora ruoergensis nucleopolyhedrovirus]
MFDETLEATNNLMCQMNNDASHILKVAMSCDSDDRLLERAQVIVNNFVLPNSLNKKEISNSSKDCDVFEVRLDLKKQQNIKQTAFELVDKYYKREHNVSINPMLRFRESDGEIALPKNACTHHLIAEAHGVVEVMRKMCEQPIIIHNAFVLLPYCRQLKIILNKFSNDYCCASLIESSFLKLNAIIADSLNRLEAIKTLHDRVQIMLVFADDKPIYECNICRNVSNEEYFLKPDECCGYRICGMCYAKLWQHCKLYPVCPVCKTSFASSCGRSTVAKTET